MSMFDLIAIPEQIHKLAKRLGLDDADLLARWRRQTEIYVSTGISQFDAQRRAYATIALQAEQRAKHRPN